LTAKTNTKLELLSPAKDYTGGVAAINCGADAVYIGAPKFGARAMAGNSLKDIEQLIQYAHRYWVKTYITVNTLLFDNELSEAEKLISQLYEIGADAIIVQDFGVLEMNLPPIPLFASTQTNNASVEKVSFLEQAGFNRVILARELSLEQISTIKQHTNIDLEFFIHGALCVCYSGQCYFSFAVNGRSANRGECSQPCRMMYDLIDSEGKVVVKDKYLLSLKDLNLSMYLYELIDAGVTSFKIEGRLKDINYIKNVTAYYRERIDSLLNNNLPLVKSSSGKVKLFFTPDLYKTFNRGYTNYFINGKNSSMSSFNSQKSLGKEIGKVTALHKDCFEIKTGEKISNGDGLCFFNRAKELSGLSVNKTEGKKIYPNEMKDLSIGTIIYRNNDHMFEKTLAGKYAERKIYADIYISEKNGQILINANDEDNNSISFEWQVEKEPAQNAEIADFNLRKQITKSGNSIFSVTNLYIHFEKPYFFPLSIINELRRNIFLKLEEERNKNRPAELRNNAQNKIHFNTAAINYRGNVTNKKSIEFYNNAGVQSIEKGLELQHNFENKTLMTCKFCIKNELGICPLETKTTGKFKEPLYLADKNKKYKLIFDCNKCEMSVIF
jgi:23S rRNA 5-hydroxycytidine C2501 synthase